MATQKLYVTEVNCETGETTQREFTAEEYAEMEKTKAEMAQREAQRQAEEQALAETKASALAKLTALGLSEDEAKAIAG